MFAAGKTFWFATGYLDDGCNELLQEVMSQQRWPVMVNEIDQQAFNVGAILILL